MLKQTTASPVSDGRFSGRCDQLDHRGGTPGDFGIRDLWRIDTPVGIRVQRKHERLQKMRTDGSTTKACWHFIIPARFADGQ